MIQIWKQEDSYTEVYLIGPIRVDRVAQRLRGWGWKPLRNVERGPRYMITVDAELAQATAYAWGLPIKPSYSTRRPEKEQNI